MSRKLSQFKELLQDLPRELGIPEVTCRKALRKRWQEIEEAWKEMEAAEEARAEEEGNT